MNEMKIETKDLNLGLEEEEGEQKGDELEGDLETKEERD